MCFVIYSTLMHIQSYCCRKDEEAAGWKEVGVGMLENNRKRVIKTALCWQAHRTAHAEKHVTKAQRFKQSFTWIFITGIPFSACFGVEVANLLDGRAAAAAGVRRLTDILSCSVQAANQAHGISRMACPPDGLARGKKWSLQPSSTTPPVVVVHLVVLSPKCL